MGSILLGILALSYGIYCPKRSGTFLHYLFKQRILQLDLHSLLTLSAQIALYVMCNHCYFY